MQWDGDLPVLNFQKLAQDHRLAYVTQGHHHCHEGWAQTHCPSCTDGRHGFHLGFNLRKGNWNCWRCGPMDRVTVIRGLLRCDVAKAHDVLRQYGGGQVAKARTRDARPSRVAPPPGLSALLKPHRRYLAHRGFDVSSCIEEWELQGTRMLSGEWSWRVVAPVRDEEARIVAYAGRSIQRDTKPKVLMTEDAKCGQDPKAFLYGIHKVPGKAVIVVEGLTDVWNMGPGAVGTLGIDWKQEQANRLRRFDDRFVMFDPEPLAQRRAEQLAEWLSLFPGNTEIITGLPTDPGALSRQRVRRIRRTLLGRV